MPPKCERNVVCKFEWRVGGGCAIYIHIPCPGILFDEGAMYFNGTFPHLSLALSLFPGRLWCRLWPAPQLPAVIDDDDAGDNANGPEGGDRHRQQQRGRGLCKESLSEPQPRQRRQLGRVARIQRVRRRWWRLKSTTTSTVLSATKSRS